jgi:hypothetical protein
MERRQVNVYEISDTKSMEFIVAARNANGGKFPVHYLVLVLQNHRLRAHGEEMRFRYYVSAQQCQLGRH